MIVISIKSKSFGGSPVLRSIDLWIRPGETVALVGPSGVGKTTLLRIAAGIDTRFEGKVVRPPETAMVFQEPNLLPWRSALQNITLIAPDTPPQMARDALDQFGLGGKADLFPGQMSLGQKRRLSLARAFATSPKFLILDEPFASLDANASDLVMGLTERIIADLQPATLLVTHSRSEAERLADRILTLHPGAAGSWLG